MISVALRNRENRHIFRTSLLAIALLCAAGVRAQDPSDTLGQIEPMSPGSLVPNSTLAGIGYPLPSVMEELWKDSITIDSLDLGNDHATQPPKDPGKEFYTLYPCGPPGYCWVRAEYLAWWMQGADTPPLVTQSPPGTDLPDAGVIGTPGTTVVIGGEPMNADIRSGFRVRMGRWCDCERTCGAEMSFFMLGANCDSRSVDCGEGDIVGRPWIDPDTGEHEAQLVCYPDVIAGTVTVDACAGNLLGLDGLMRHNICCDPCCSYDVNDCCKTSIRRDFLIGFRYLHYEDGLTIREALTPLSDFVVPGTRIDLEDSFRARDDFYGIKLGLDCQRHRGRWSLEVRPELSFGIMHRRVKINGATVVTIPGAPTNVMEGGLLALSSNIGEYCSTRAVVVPELDLQVGYLVRPNIRLLAGYSLLYIPNMLRAAEQLDSYVNPELVPPIQPPVTGSQRPAYMERESDVWLQGLTLGAECRF